MKHRRLRILTWHVHGNYLWYLTQAPHDFFLATDAARSMHHGGASGILPWGPNVHEVPVERIAAERFDAVLYQSRHEWTATAIATCPRRSAAARRSTSSTIRRRSTRSTSATGWLPKASRTCCSSTARRSTR